MNPLHLLSLAAIIAAHVLLPPQHAVIAYVLIASFNVGIIVAVLRHGPTR